MTPYNLLLHPKFKARFDEVARHLSAFQSLDDLHRSPAYAANLPFLKQLLEEPCWETRAFESSPPKPWARCISWNIEKGKKLKAIIKAFQSDSRLHDADLVFLQESDVGMARSGNQFIARELALGLGMNYAFVPSFIELTKGVGDDLDAPGENQTGFQGNAILSRFPILNARSIPLPQCFQPFEFTEKRYGMRNALVCDLSFRDKAFTAVSIHLEVRNTPMCRARQMAELLLRLQHRSKSPVLMGGDFNSNTFARGNALRTLISFLRLTLQPPDSVVASTVNPESREPLFEILSRGGFVWRNLNDGAMTSTTFLRSVEDLRYIPAFLSSRARNTMSAFEKGLPLRLDWFAGRNVLPAYSCLSNIHAPSTLISYPPLTVDLFEDGTVPETISDHRPIMVDVCL
jgi:endonuclease/exonuclease/phosphatase family metal-dependent hydrolase